MESKAERESEESSSNGLAVVAGIACGIIGAVAGAVGYHYMAQKEEPHQSSACSKKYSDGLCAICMSDTDEIVLLPCGHEYHKSCMLQMKDSVKVLFCPKCKQKIPENFLRK